MKSLKKIPSLIKGTTSTILMLICLMAFSLQTRAADYYWVNGSGNWSDYGAHWSTTSGGSIFHTTIPTLNDNVFFDGNSFTADSQQVYLDSTFAYCHDMDWSGVNYKVKFYTGLPYNTNINIYGSLTLDADIYYFSCSVNFMGNAPNLSLNASGAHINGKVTFNGTGTWSLLDSLGCWRIEFANGVFHSNNHNISALQINGWSPNSPFVDMGSSNLSCNNLNVGTNSNFNGADSRVIITGDYLNSGNLACVNHSFKTISFLCERGYISGSIIADTIHFNGLGSFNGSQSPQYTLQCNYLICDSSAYIRNSYSQTSFIMNAIFSGESFFSGKTTFDTLHLNNSGYNITIQGTIEVNDTLIFDGNCSAITNIIGYNSSGTLIKTSGTVEFDHVRLINMTGSGGAVFIANNSFDLGNNNGWQINIPVSRDLFWVNGPGTWSDSSHWSLTSGGPGGNCAPNPSDNIFFDAQSFSSAYDTVIIDYPTIFCNNLNIQGLSGIPVFNRLGWSTYNFTLTVSGSLTVLSDILLYGLIKFDSDAPANTINSTSYLPSINFDGNGAWSLDGNLNCQSIGFQKGAFYSNNYNITAISIGDATNASSMINIGTSIINCGGFDLTDVGANLTSQNATLVFDSTLNSYTSYFTTDNQSFNIIHFQTVANINGDFSCNELVFEKECTLNSNVAVVQKIVLNSHSDFNGTFTVDSLIQNSLGTRLEFGTGSILNIGSSFEIATGTCDATTIIHADSSATFTKLSGSVDLDYILLENIQATGGAAFNATNCIDMGGNQGWNIASPASRDMYWIGGPGNWSDQSHWALSSGGFGGNCIPNLYDNIFFDDNSFSSAIVIETILIDVPEAYVNNFNFNSSYNSLWLLKSFQAMQDGSIMINGSLNLSTKTRISSNNLNLIFTSPDPGNIILSGESEISDVNLHFKGQGIYTLLDSLSCNMITFEQGDFIASGNPVNCQKLKVSSPQVNIDFGINNLYCDSIDCFAAGPGFLSQNLNIILNPFAANYIKTNYQTFKSIKGGGFGLVKFKGSITCETMELSSNTSFDSNGGSNIIQANKMVVMNDLNTFNSFTYFNIDTLLLNNAGHSVDLRPGDTLEVNIELGTNATAGFPIELKCYQPGNFVIESSAGMICMDNMIMQGVHVIGGGVFYAGANTVDLGNNSGWTYATCNPANTDVWPGDANYDLTVNNFDVLNVGLGYNAAGPVRPGATNNWVAQPASDWAFQFANGANLKNADCNGDGIISNVDTTAISLNYGLTHPLRLSNPGSASLPGPPLYVVATPDTVMEGDTVQVDIFLGTTQIPVDSIYGLAFTLTFDSTLIDTTYMPFDYSTSWMGIQNVDLLTFEKKFLSAGRVEIAITRTDMLNMAGSGIVLTTGVVIIDNIGARLSSAPPFVNLPITISNVRAVTAGEYYFSLSWQGDNVEIDTLGTTGINDVFTTNDRFMVYPNPAREVLHINSGGIEIQQLELSDKMGSVRRVSYPNSSKSTLDTRSLSAGVYLLKATTAKGVVVRKVIIANK